MNFIPTPNREHEARILQDFLMFERKIRLKHHFGPKEQDEEDEETESPHKILHPSSGWTPYNVDPKIDTYKNVTLMELKSHFEKKQKPRYNYKKLPRGNSQHSTREMQDSEERRPFYPNHQTS